MAVIILDTHIWIRAFQNHLKLLLSTFLSSDSSCVHLVTLSILPTYVRNGVKNAKKLSVQVTFVTWPTNEKLISGIINQGPVVQSIVSLTSSLRGQLVRCFTTLFPNILIFFVEKM